MAKDSSKWGRVDLLIAMCALLISSLTAGAAIYQGRMISNQLSVTVWPYISFRSTLGDSDVELRVENVGAGPAVIRNATLLVDGKPQPSIITAVGLLGFHPQHANSLAITSLAPGEVIRAGDSVLLAHVHSVSFAKQGAALQRRVRVQVCYCSILDQCWLARTDTESPAELKTCATLPRTSIRP
jgi:hypothetical protein